MAVNWLEILQSEYKVWHLEPDGATLAFVRTEAENGRGAQALRVAVETLSGGKNTVVTDRSGYPSVMVRVPLLRACDLLRGEDSRAPHPAFRLGGHEIPEILAGKYMTSLLDGHPVSLPLRTPECSGDCGDAFRAAQDKGEGWTIMPWQLWFALSLKSLRNGTLPGGNTDNGTDYYHRDESGVLDTENEEKLVLCGSGPFRWTHDHTPAGIWDLTGNLNEWESCMRLVNGEIQMVSMTDLLTGPKAEDPSDLNWTALDREGKPVPPGGADTLRYGPALGGKATFTYANGVRLTVGADDSAPEDADVMGNCDFQDISASEGFEPCAELKMLGLYPTKAPGEPKELGWRWITTKGEAYPLAGGAYRSTYHSGLFFTGITKERNSGYMLSGSRLIRVDPEYLKLQ